MKQLTREQAIAFAENKCYEGWTARQTAEFQLHQRKLCMPWGVFTEAIEEALGRSVWTHEFAKPGLLIKELSGDRPAPTMQEIIEMIPAEKRIIIGL